jgi:hypothetical protein
MLSIVLVWSKCSRPLTVEKWLFRARRLQLCRQRRLQSIEFVWNAKPVSAKWNEDGGKGGSGGGEREREDGRESKSRLEVRGSDGRRQEEGVSRAGHGRGGGGVEGWNWREGEVML